MVLNRFQCLNDLLFQKTRFLLYTKLWKCRTEIVPRLGESYMTVILTSHYTSDSLHRLSSHIQNPQHSTLHLKNIKHNNLLRNQSINHGLNLNQDINIWTNSTSIINRCEHYSLTWLTIYYLSFMINHVGSKAQPFNVYLVFFSCHILPLKFLAMYQVCDPLLWVLAASWVNVIKRWDLGHAIRTDDLHDLPFLSYIHNSYYCVALL